MKRLLIVSNEPYRPGMGSTNRQRLARAACDAGWDVTYVETIGRLSASVKRSRVEDGIQVLHARNVLPWSAQPWNVLGRMLNQLLTSVGLLSTKFDLVVTYDPLWLTLLKAVRTRRRIYDCVDAYEFQPQYAGRLNRAILLRTERRLARSVDRRVSTSPLLSQYKTTQWGCSTDTLVGAHEWPTGADQSLERGADPLAESGHIALLVSALDAYKLDPAPIIAWLELNPQNTLRLYGKSVVGEGHDVLGLLENPQVDFRGVLNATDFPQATADCSFGWISLTESRYSQFSFPLKVWDYLANGLPVVAIGAPSLSGIDGVLSSGREGVAHVTDMAISLRSWKSIAPFSARARWEALSS